MFTSDNGYLLGEHRLTGKTQLYEESAKVPMIIRGPDLPRRHDARAADRQHRPDADDPRSSRRRRALAPVDGVSLLPVARNPGADRVASCCSRTGARPALQDGRYVYIEHDSDQGGGTDEYELYDLERDPRQLENLHVVDAPAVRPEVLSKRPELAAIRNSLAARLDELRNCQGAGCH